MNIAIIKIHFKCALLALLFGVVFFAGSAITAHAMTTEEHFASMQRQLDIASLQVQSIVAMRKVSMVLGASTSSSELQAMIDALMAQIAALQNANPQPQPVAQKLFFKTVQIEKEIEVGQQDTPIATVQISKIKGENYLNQILVRVSPARRNINTLPWESFSQMSVWVGGYKVKGVNVNDPSLWKTVTTERGTKVYEFALFNGNQKLPNTLNKNVTATIAVTSTNKAVAKDVWTMWVPVNGVTIWNPTQKHTKYGPTERFKYTMIKGSNNNEPTLSTKEVTVTSGRATIQTAYHSPFSVRVTGSYNDNKSCDAGVQYIVNYSDGTEDTFVTDASCKKKTFSKVHTFVDKIQRNYSVYIELYGVLDNSWTHFVQSASLVRVNANGSLSTEKNDISTWTKG